MFSQPPFSWRLDHPWVVKNGPASGFGPRRLHCRHLRRPRQPPTPSFRRVSPGRGGTAARVLSSRERGYAIQIVLIIPPFVNRRPPSKALKLLALRSSPAVGTSERPWPPRTAHTGGGGVILSMRPHPSPESLAGSVVCPPPPPGPPVPRSPGPPPPPAPRRGPGGPADADDGDRKLPRVPRGHPGPGPDTCSAMMSPSEDP